MAATALSLFEERGFDEVTVEEVAEAAMVRLGPSTAPSDRRRACSTPVRRIGRSSCAGRSSPTRLRTRLGAYERTTLQPRWEDVIAEAITDRLGGTSRSTCARACWPAWVPEVLDPVIAKGTDQFLFRARNDGRIEHHQGQVILRGPTHTFALEAGGAACGSAPDRARREQWVVAVLDGLASHLDDTAQQS